MKVLCDENLPLSLAPALRKAGIDPIAADRQSPAYLQKFLPAEMTSWAAQVKTIGIPLQ